MRLILVRHGQTSSNVGLVLDTGAPGADLNEYGRQQARALVGQLEQEPIEAIYASNLVRTQQTAQPLALHRGLNITVLEGLREISAGDGEMTTDATDYIGTLMKWHAGDLQARIRGAENALEFFDRFDAAIGEVVEQGYRNAAVFSHGAALRVWASARVPGFSDALGGGHFANTGHLIVEGSHSGGWILQSLEGVMHYQSQPDSPTG